MEERQVTSDGVTRALPQPFFVFATQNNIEMTGTYPLPEARLDRFFARVSLGYPSRSVEADILDHQRIANPITDVKQVATPEQMIDAQKGVRQIYVHESVREYCVDIVRSTRENSQLTLGASPRGSLYVMHAAQAKAAMDGNDFVKPDDVKYVAPMVLGHRLILRGEVRARGLGGADIVRQILDKVPTPATTG
jgi:MoxR-like ATPase